MKLELTKEEYRVLLDILHIADVVISGHRRNEDPRSEGHRMLIQKLYGLAGEAGLGNLIGFDEKRKRYRPGEELENGSPVHTFVDEFAGHVFWDELIARLTVRDVTWQAGGRDQLLALSDDAREALERPVRERYVGEFSRNGVSNLALVDHFGGAEEGPAETSD